jgi:hypothetical protein
MHPNEAQTIVEAVASPQESKWLICHRQFVTIIISFVPRSVMSLAIAALVIPLAGCGLLPSSTPEPTANPEYRSEVIGVIASVKLVENGVLDVTTRRGQSIRLRTDEDIRLLNTQPEEGSLMFAGHASDGSLWFYAQRPGPSEDCYLVTGLIEGDVGAAELHFDFGLVLPKARDFDAGSGNFRRPQGSAFCVNEQGEVTRLYE